MGLYDARLRAACRRLCWILSVPFTVVEAQEARVEDVRAKALLERLPELQREVEERKAKQKKSLMRYAKIGGFAVLGGAALAVTGGLAAPLMAPAFGALVTATTATIGAIGTVGTAILGGGAIASAFAAVVGGATHAAGLAAVLTPVLTTANVTVLFGAGGVALGGFKAFRRTADSDVFMIRSVNEVEHFASKPSADTDHTVNSLAEIDQAVKEPDNVLLDLTSITEEVSRPGFVVPSHTRSTAMSHTSRLPAIKKRFRRIVFAVDCQLKDFSLRLTALKLINGVWGVVPPSKIKFGRSGVFACMNRFAAPTGTGFIVCYTATPLDSTVSSRPLRVWVRVVLDFIGGWEASCYCEPIVYELDPFASEYWLETNVHKDNFTQRGEGMVLEMHLKPFCYIKIYAAASEKYMARRIIFPAVELPQLQEEYLHDAPRRRKIGISFVNRSSHSLTTKDEKTFNGEQWRETPIPMRIEPAEASLTVFTNADWSLEGAEAFFILEIVNSYDNPLRPNYYFKVQFEISAGNHINMAIAASESLRELRQMELRPETPPGSSFDVELRHGLFFSLRVKVLEKPGVIQVIISNLIESKSGAVKEHVSQLIGVCGYSTIFDPRRSTQDQQVGLWQPVLETSRLVSPSEAYALHWEDEYLMKFGETIKVDVQVADYVSKRTIKSVKKYATKKILQGALFSGFYAFKTLIGAFDMPMYAIWAADVIDNNFAVLSNRAEYAGKDLAAALLDKERGARPVTLVGYSFGCKVIAECLHELDNVKAYHVVENVYLLGATFPADRDYWSTLRRVVAGRLINVYTRSDLLLWLMYKVNEGDLKPMGGVAPVNVPGVENMDATPVLAQHSEYAFKLQETLDMIPLVPNKNTWLPRTKYGSPGTIIPSLEAKETVKKMGHSLNSILKSNPYCSFGVRNSIVSDVPGFSCDLQYVSSSLMHCFYDFLPPEQITPGHAGVFGVVGESDDGMCGYFTFRLSLEPYSAKDLVLVAFFSADTADHVNVHVEPFVLARRAAQQETDEEAEERLHTIIAETAPTPEDVRALCVTPPSIVHGGCGSVRREVTLPLEGLFLDQHKMCTFHLHVEKTPGGVLVNLVALCASAASQLDQEKFTDSKYDADHVHDADCEAEQKEMDELSIAPLHPLENLQNTLNGFASTCDAAKRSVVPIVVVNCSEVPLYLDVASDLTTVIPAPPSEDPSVLHRTTWNIFPPPSIEAKSFAILTLPRVAREDARFPSLVYETANHNCRFSLYFSPKDGGANDMEPIAVKGGVQGQRRRGRQSGCVDGGDPSPTVCAAHAQRVLQDDHHQGHGSEISRRS
ncbi:hypothetical protein STCU_07994 [Strigomonas culicis]|uniref:Transmembrane protein n=1 Tax=Strigomonas culicis TaxID=28005 RepID=S9VIC6_9TRYP|nr:hypothetical protein STCU_07994 [Strigomonas culicis]|eukprot:EPY22965.1 hypothetical protein STCU_07994 [Strigomonas culicis]